MINVTRIKVSESRYCVSSLLQAANNFVLLNSILAMNIFVKVARQERSECQNKNNTQTYSLNLYRMPVLFSSFFR